MTPMIDVIFQIAIFFVVAINLSQNVNPEIRLEKGPYGRIPDGGTTGTMFAVDVDQKGGISVNNLPLSQQTFRAIIRARYERMGGFPVLIRSDLRTRHADIRTVMNTCTEIGIHRIWFATGRNEKRRSR